MKTFHYKAFGLSIESEIECPELLPDSNTPAVVIRHGEVPMTMEDAKDSGVVYQAKPDQFLLRLDGIARFMVSHGKEIVVEPDINSSANDVRVFLLGSVFGALLHQRGVFPLHASVIETSAGAVMFVGPSGVGKSTLAAAFQKRGYRVLADDIGAISFHEDGTPIVLPAYPRMKLWADMAEALERDDGSIIRMRAGLEKYSVPLREDFVQDALPLHAVYAISTETSAQELKMKELVGITGFEVFINNTYRRRFLDGLDGRAGHFEKAAAIARRTKVSRVTRSRHPFLLDELVQLLEEDFA